jgi:hypothetical protein
MAILEKLRILNYLFNFTKNRRNNNYLLILLILLFSLFNIVNFFPEKLFFFFLFLRFNVIFIIIVPFVAFFQYTMTKDFIKNKYQEFYITNIYKEINLLLFFQFIVFKIFIILTCSFIIFILNNEIGLRTDYSLYLLSQESFSLLFFFYVLSIFCCIFSYLIQKLFLDYDIDLYIIYYIIVVIIYIICICFKIKKIMFFLS